MRKFLFAALAFVSLGLASCSDDNGGTSGTDDYEFTGAHLSFEYTLKGDVAALVDVLPTATLPADMGTVSTSSDGNTHTLFITNMKCPAKFDVVYILKPKKSVVIEQNKNYEYTANYNYTVIRNFSDDSHIPGSTGGETLTGVIPGAQADDFFEKYGTQTFSFNISTDGYVVEGDEE